MDTVNSIGAFAKGAFYTVAAKFAQPCKNLNAMRLAQHDRYDASKAWLMNSSFKTDQLAARTKYWLAQTFFLGRLLKANGMEFKNKNEFKTQLLKLRQAIDNNGLDDFLSLLKRDDIILESQLNASTITTSSSSSATRTGSDITAYRQGINLYHGDVISLVDQLVAEGYHVVVDDAPNSNRDGCAKYSAGTVEELLCRHTDGWKMALHFEDVHQRNFENNQYAFGGDKKPATNIDVKDYQKRYLKMMLGIVIKVVEQGEGYLKTKQFMSDLLESEPSSNGLPIYFDMQNNAYEVPIDGFASLRSFANIADLNSVDDIFVPNKHFQSIVPMTVVSYAAPDLRKIEVAPLDQRCTSNSILQNPEGNEVLSKMLGDGINRHCAEAIQRAKNSNQPVAALFIMPGCGAFGNPERITTEILFDAIKKNYDQLQTNNVNVYVAERNPKLFSIMASTCAEKMGTKVPHFVTREKQAEYEHVKYDVNGTTIELRRQNINLNDDVQQGSNIVTILPKNLSVKTKQTLNIDPLKTAESSVIAVDVPKKYHLVDESNFFLKDPHDVGNQADLANQSTMVDDAETCLKNCYLAGLRELLWRNDPHVTEAHFILMGTGKLGYSAQESMLGFLAAVDEVRNNLDGKKLPRLIMHIDEDSDNNYSVCGNILASCGQNTNSSTSTPPFTNPMAHSDQISRQKLDLPTAFWIRTPNARMERFDDSVDIYSIDELKNMIKPRFGITKSNESLVLVGGAKYGRPLTESDAGKIGLILAESSGRLTLIVTS